MKVGSTLSGKIVLEYLEKWESLPSLTLAKLIYSRDDNHKLFKDVEHVRSVIRYYRGTTGHNNRCVLKNKKYVRTTTPIE